MADVNAAISKCSLLSFLQGNYQMMAKEKYLRILSMSLLILPITFFCHESQEGVFQITLARSLEVLPLQNEIQIASSTQRTQKLFPEKSLWWIPGISIDHPQHNELNFLDSKEEFTQVFPCVRALL